MGSRMGCWILALSCILGVAVAAQTAPPPDVTYQGLLLDSMGDPVAGPVNIEIGVWDSLVGGRGVESLPACQFFREVSLGLARHPSRSW